ncbi:MAG: hypothetical protein F6J94_08175 [Moorea sp. SIO1F2]|uniref:hypothetical protein n=1 Tax=Moorena sp. SIO1F2 TaxID=2607819 RepID=UPI0013B76C57|nr:hypothetical protein [Moorena sp. SIO1F2]NET81919.1 hypothetical protein [Moorena sp. SIO1F2]
MQISLNIYFLDCQPSTLAYWPRYANNLQPPTSNLQPPTSNLQPSTSNLQPPSSNLQPSISRLAA